MLFVMLIQADTDHRIIADRSRLKHLVVDLVDRINLAYHSNVQGKRKQQLYGTIHVVVS